MPSIVQAAHASANSNSLSVSFVSNITAGNSVVVCVAGNAALSTSTLTVAPVSGADTYTEDVNDTLASSIWRKFSSAGGYKQINLATNSGTQAPGLEAWIYEVTPLTALDKTSSNGAGTSTSSFTSNATATTTQATEAWFGVGEGVATTGSAFTATGPGGSWTNEAGQSVDNGSQDFPAVSGHQFVTSTGTATYSGTLSGTCSFSGGCVATYKYTPPATNVALTVAQVTVTARLTSAGPAINLPPAQVTITAYAVSRGSFVNLPVASINVRAFPPKTPLFLPVAQARVQAFPPFVGALPTAPGVLQVWFGSALGSGIYLPGTPGGAGGPGGPSAPGISSISGLGSGWEIAVLAAPAYNTLLAVIPAKMITGFQFVQQLDDTGSGTVTMNMDDIWWGPGWSFAPSGVPTASNYFTCSLAEATLIAPGDTFSWSGQPGTIYTVTGLVPSGSNVNVFFTPPV